MSTDYRHKFTWYAIMEDGSEIAEFDTQGQWIPFANIDQSKVKFFGMQDAQGNRRHWVDLKTGTFTINGQETRNEEMPEGPYGIIWFKRIQRFINAESPNESIRFVIGIKKTEAGLNQQWMAFIDGADPDQVMFTNEK